AFPSCPSRLRDSNRSSLFVPRSAFSFSAMRIPLCIAAFVVPCPAAPAPLWYNSVAKVAGEGRAGSARGRLMERRHGTTRREILDALRRSAGLTADQLAESLGVTAMAIRKHLAALQTEGLLTAHTERRPVGRPVHIYALAPGAQEVFPQQYQDL